MQLQEKSICGQIESFFFFFFPLKQQFTFKNKEDLIIWFFYKISPYQSANKKVENIQALTCVQLTIISQMFCHSCWTRYWGCTSLICKWDRRHRLFSFMNISCQMIFRFIWYSNFTSYISQLLFILDRYISLLIIVCLENSYPVYTSLFPHLPFHFPSWNSVSNWNNPTPKSWYTIIRNHYPL